MQDKDEKFLRFKRAIGKVIKRQRLEYTDLSISQLALQYELDKGTVSRLERGLVECYVSTLWKIAEASGIKFSELVKLIEEELGEDFKFMDE